MQHYTFINCLQIFHRKNYGGIVWFLKETKQLAYCYPKSFLSDSCVRYINDTSTINVCISNIFKQVNEGIAHANSHWKTLEPFSLAGRQSVRVLSISKILLRSKQADYESKNAQQITSRMIKRLWMATVKHQITQRAVISNKIIRKPLSSIIWSLST